MSGSHPLLAQVALTVSPFAALPAATTLPYTYRSLPPGLPPSSTAEGTASGGTNKPAFVVSSSGQAAHPSDIQASCHKLQAHLQQTREDSSRKFGQWEKRIQERELAEKRRVAPGWLDRDEKILQPERRAGPAPALRSASSEPSQRSSIQLAATATAEGEELDRAFGSLGVH